MENSVKAAGKILLFLLALALLWAKLDRIEQKIDIMDKSMSVTYE